MKKLFLIAVAFVSSTLSLSAQVVKGDMNDDGQLTVADLTNTATRILENAPLEYISTGGNPYQADNSLIVGTWYSANGQTVTFNSDGSQDLYPDYQYKYQPTLGRILFVNPTGGIIARLVYNFDNEKLVMEFDNFPLYLYNTRPEPYNGHEYVDLGLSVKWATCNVGAEKPEEYGLYFAWGETKGYGQDTSDGYQFDWTNYKWCKSASNNLTKYCTSSSDGTVDNKTVLTPEDDAAHVNWGGSWRMPTRAELEELRTKCTWTWETQNDVDGYKVTSKTNGNFIFLPAAGRRNDISSYGAGHLGAYWSSSLIASSSHSSYFLESSASSVRLHNGYRFYGYPVRPVCP